MTLPSSTPEIRDFLRMDAGINTLEGVRLQVTLAMGLAFEAAQSAGLDPYDPPTVWAHCLERWPGFDDLMGELSSAERNAYLKAVPSC